MYAAAALVLAYPDQRLIDRLDAIEETVAQAGAGEQFAPLLAHLRGPMAEERAARLEAPGVGDHAVAEECEARLEAPGVGDHAVAEERAARLEAPAATLRDARSAGSSGIGGESHLTEIQARHAQEFDYSRRHALNLTYWIDGDTRRRGESLLRYKQAYRDSGLLVDLGGELPDYLPMILEFAVHDPERGRDLLSASRPALELLRFALRDDDLPHEGVIAAICATLPGAAPTDRLSVAGMAGWQPPTETVGIGDLALAPYAAATPATSTSQTREGRVPHGLRLPILNQQEL